MQTVLVTGAHGFIGRNLTLSLSELGYRTIPITRASSGEEIIEGVSEADAIIHLAGANRPADPAEFMEINHGSARQLVAAMEQTGRRSPIIMTSSIKAGEPTEYGKSKRAGEEVLLSFGRNSGNPIHIFRLPNVFGKWARPNYNSAVATFCHRVARGLPIDIHDRQSRLSLVYIDDVVAAFVAILANGAASGYHHVKPTYAASVGQVADLILGFARTRETGLIGSVGNGLHRALYATYVASLPPDRFSYPITTYSDPRGAFAEMLKTCDSGQFSVFNALPGVTRGGHYHHTKTEKFLIVHGRARFGFRHIISGEYHSLETSADEFRIVETVPGWAHDVTNVGEDVMVSLLWANELFDRERPDTITAAVGA